MYNEDYELEAKRTEIGFYDIVEDINIEIDSDIIIDDTNKLPF